MPEQHRPEKLGAALWRLLRTHSLLSDAQLFDLLAVERRAEGLDDLPLMAVVKHRNELHELGAITAAGRRGKAVLWRAVPLEQDLFAPEADADERRRNLLRAFGWHNVGGFLERKLLWRPPHTHDAVTEAEAFLRLDCLGPLPAPAVPPDERKRSETAVEPPEDQRAS